MKMGRPTKSNDPLTEDERKLIESVIPETKRVAKHYAIVYGNQFDFQSTIFLRLCRSIHRYDPEKGGIRQWATSHSHFACRELLRENMKGPLTLIANDAVLESQEARQPVDMTIDDEILHGLTSREKDVVLSTCIDGEELASVGTRYGLHPCSITRIKTQAMAFLRSKTCLT